MTKLHEVYYDSEGPFLAGLTCSSCDFTMPTVHLLDYVAGNVRSLANAIEKLGFQIEWIKEPEQIEFAEVRG